MSFAPRTSSSKAKKVPDTRNRPPNIRLKERGGRTASAHGRSQAPVSEDEQWPILGSDGPLPVCWLCGLGCPKFGWYIMPRELSTQSGAALNYFTLCASCTPLVGELQLSNTDVLATCGDNKPVPVHSDAFVSFLREYKVLLEIVSSEKEKHRKDGSDAYHDLPNLRQLLHCVNSVLSTVGMTSREIALLKLELSNLQEQVQIHTSGSSGGGGGAPRSSSSGRSKRPKTNFGASFNSPNTSHPKGLALPKTLGGGGSGGGGGGGGGPRSASKLSSNISLDSPSETYAKPPSTPSGVVLDSNMTRMLQEELRRLQHSNTDALQKLQMLTHQHRELAGAHELKCEELKTVQATLMDSRAREGDLEARISTLTAEAARERGYRQSGSTTEADLRQRLAEAEQQLRLRPESSREELRRSQESRMQAVEEARELRAANAQIGERLLKVEEQLFQEQQESRNIKAGFAVMSKSRRSPSPISSPIKLSSGREPSPTFTTPNLTSLMSSEVNLLQESWDQQV